jgi:hypothetical protein
VSREKAYQDAMQKAGMPKEIAKKVAKILDKDDPKQPNLGRTKDEQDLINESVKHIAQ